MPQSARSSTSPTAIGSRVVVFVIIFTNSFLTARLRRTASTPGTPSSCARHLSTMSDALVTIALRDIGAAARAAEGASPHTRWLGQAKRLTPTKIACPLDWLGQRFADRTCAVADDIAPRRPVRCVLAPIYARRSR